MRLQGKELTDEAPNSFTIFRLDPVWQRRMNPAFPSHSQQQLTGPPAVLWSTIYKMTSRIDMFFIL
jgi:hypothetical protein